MRRLPVLSASLALGMLALRPHLVVRAIRALDRRGGLATVRGERVYAGAVGLFAGLHARAAADTAATLNGTGTVVDLGAGPGDLLAALGALAPGIERIGIEPSGEMRAIASGRGVNEIDGRAEALPLPDSADLVVSTLSAHHWQDPVAAVREMARVLRPGGEARIYDVRFAAFSTAEARSLATAAGLDRSTVARRVLDERLFGLRPYCLITLRP